jgi:hypothetical protein
VHKHGNLQVVVNSTTFFLPQLLEIAMRKHYDVTNIFQQKLDAIKYDYTWKDYAACVIMAAAIAVPFAIYLW